MSLNVNLLEKAERATQADALLTARSASGVLTLHVQSLAMVVPKHVNVQSHSNPTMVVHHALNFLRRQGAMRVAAQKTVRSPPGLNGALVTRNVVVVR
jgi:hypothetical protein